MKEPDETLRVSFRTWVQENTPPGTRLVIHFDSLLGVEVCCDGAVPVTTYVCCLCPDHAGDCYSRHKRVNFVPERGGPFTHQENTPSFDT